MTFERLLFVFRFSKSLFNVSQTNTLPVETLLKKKNKQANKMPKHHREIRLKRLTFYVSFLHFLFFRYIVPHHLEAKSHITCNAIQ